ncbi:alpha/beta fold hydrolase [Streptomyces fructofermentans]|uniref:Alpha/beta hydrolase n=1 Tax=Streptomyces fructofermentans TaxID=152141 RepID=A0A918K7T9_9ACTN|nr:alpha/beta fold hydrolase [Streptomyces fructofermentans]GGX50327.1 alpha/beta hydrolase [Streptomyces fructofermentans]
MPSGIRMRDGRWLTFEEWGDPEGTPVVLLHGTPGGRQGLVPPEAAKEHPGVRFISYDRAGYGESDRGAGRRVAQAARDVATLTDALEIGRFAVLGHGGGGPHALACAALLPSRVRRVAVTASLAPPVAEGLDWFEGMAASAVDELSRALTEPVEFADRLAARAAAIRTDPAQYLASIRDGLSDADRRVLATPAVSDMLLRSYREALGGSAYGWLDDSLALLSHWGFDPEQISRPVLLWHGAQDTLSPVGHFEWLAGHIPRARPVLDPEGGHFSALEALPDILDWLRATPRSDA